MNFLRLIALTSFLFLSSFAYTQVAVRGGLNYSNVSVDGDNVDFGAGSKIGYHLGLQGDFVLAGLRLRPGLLYHVKGGKGESSGATGNTNLHYLEVPVNMALKIGGDAFSIIAEAGPYFGYLLNTSSGFIDNLDDRLNKSDWGINFGGAIELQGLGVGINYSNSLSNIAKDEQISGAFKTTNGNLTLFGYLKF